MKSDLNKIDAKLLFESLIATLSLIFSIVLLIWNFSDFSTFYQIQNEYTSDDIATTIIIFLPAISIGLFWIVFNIFTSIRLLSLKWNNNWCKSYKTIFGLVSLFLFLSFFLLIFVFVAKYKINKERKQSNNYNDYSDENTITRNLDFNKLKSYRTKSILLIILIALTVIFAIVSNVLTIKNSNSNILMPLALKNLLISFVAFYLLMNISMSLIIMFSSWDIDWCRKNRILFGLLSLIFSFITILIFTNTGLKKGENQLHNLTREVNESYNNSILQMNNQPFQNSYNPYDPNYQNFNNRNNRPLVENYDDYDETPNSKAADVADAVGTILGGIGDILGSL